MLRAPLYLRLTSPRIETNQSIKVPLRMDISSYTWGVATASLSMRPEDTIERKFTALQAAGFKNCELGFSGYMEWVRQQRPDL